MMEFRQSQTEDLDQIVRIAEDAKAFLRANGVSQWQRGTYPDRALFASDIENGIGYVMGDGNRVCAVCGTIPSLSLNPAKARVLLTLCLMKGMDLSAITARIPND